MRDTQPHDILMTERFNNYFSLKVDVLNHSSKNTREGGEWEQMESDTVRQLPTWLHQQPGEVSRQVIELPSLDPATAGRFHVYLLQKAPSSERQKNKIWWENTTTEWMLLGKFFKNHLWTASEFSQGLCHGQATCDMGFILLGQGQKEGKKLTLIESMPYKFSPLIFMPIPWDR